MRWGPSDHQTSRGGSIPQVHRKASRAQPDGPTDEASRDSASPSLPSCLGPAQKHLCSFSSANLHRTPTDTSRENQQAGRCFSAQCTREMSTCHQGLGTNPQSARSIWFPNYNSIWRLQKWAENQMTEAENDYLVILDFSLLKC